MIPEPGSPVTRKPLRSLKLPRGSIIGAIRRGDEVILASGDTHVMEGEQVIVFCREDVVPQFEKLFSRKRIL